MQKQRPPYPKTIEALGPKRRLSSPTSPLLTQAMVASCQRRIVETLVVGLVMDLTVDLGVDLIVDLGVDLVVDLGEDFVVDFVVDLVVDLVDRCGEGSAKDLSHITYFNCGLRLRNQQRFRIKTVRRPWSTHKEIADKEPSPRSQ